MSDTAWSLLPPLLAIGLAIATRRVYLSLFAGVVTGAILSAGGDIPAAIWRLISYHSISPFCSVDRLSLLSFILLIGSSVALMGESGGTAALVSRMVRFASSRIRAQVFAGLAGLLIFFDDYASCLMVGPAFLPVFAHHRLSRAKLAYIVDSTAASISSIFFISTWIGYEVGLIDQALAILPPGPLSSLSAYGVFLDSIPHRFYLLFAIALVFILAFSGRDFGPMLTAERAPAPAPASRPGRESGRGAWLLAALPMSVLLLGTLAGLGISGRASLAEAGRLTDASFRDLIGAANSYRAMLFASIASFLCALALSSLLARLEPGRLFRVSLRGAWLMVPPLLILVFAWALGDICVELKTGPYVGRQLADVARPWLLPTLVFIAGAGISFATGTSFGTMAIMMPVAVPLAVASGTAAGIPVDGLASLIVSTVGAVLAGAVFGDHCSIISDTTILSATATNCGLLEHFRTQAPYAFLAALVAVIAGTLPAGLGLPVWVCLGTGLILLAAAVRLLGRRP
jgi:Na+/H+ antiporter NhaC